MSNQPPSLGRVVHYHAVKGTKDDGSLNVVTLAADITKVHDDFTVDLLVKDSSDRVFADHGASTIAMYRVPLSSSYGQPNAWSWPPFIAAKADVVKPKIVEDTTADGAGAPSPGA